MNSVSIIGRLTKPPVYAEPKNGQTFARFTLQTNEFELDDQGEANKLKHFHRARAWGSHVNLLKQLGDMRSSLAIEGRLVNSFTSGKGGKRRILTEIEVRDLRIV